jgi:hypothetical protein
VGFIPFWFCVCSCVSPCCPGHGPACCVSVFVGEQRLTAGFLFVRQFSSLRTRSISPPGTRYCQFVFFPLHELLSGRRASPALFFHFDFCCRSQFIDFCSTFQRRTLFLAEIFWRWSDPVFFPLKAQVHLVFQLGFLLCSSQLAPGCLSFSCCNFSFFGPISICAPTVPTARSFSSSHVGSVPVKVRGHLCSSTRCCSAVGFLQPTVPALLGLGWPSAADLIVLISPICSPILGLYRVVLFWWVLVLVNDKHSTKCL